MRLSRTPKNFKDRVAVRSRTKSVYDKNVKKLNQYVSSLQKSRGANNHIPWFDPADGGVNAKILLVGEAPGGQARASGFVSTDNNDETAKNMFLFRDHVGLKRKQLVHWNIVPWYVGTGRRISRPNQIMRRDGAIELAKLLKLLPKLRVIILLGKTAQVTYRMFFRDPSPQGLTILDSPHPSPQYVNRAPKNKERIIFVLRKAKRIISNPGA